MRFPLRAKLIVLYLIIAVVGFCGVALGGGALVRKQYQNETITKLYKDANYIAASYQVNNGTIPQSLLESIAYTQDVTVWIISPQGEIQLYTGSQEPNPLSGVFNPASGIQGYYMIGDFYGSMDEETLSVYVPLVTDINVQGYVVIHYSMNQIVLESDQQLLFSYITFGGFMLLLLILFIIMDIVMIRPLQKVRTSAIEYTNGNLSYPNTVTSMDEIGEIAVMQEDLAKQLGSSSEDQHRFLANISHDFRSPLTSIKGYMVAIQDGTIPPELQPKYINIVIQESERLTKLANSLLDMIQLEKGIILDIRTFDINDLIRSTLQTFEGTMKAKNVSAESVFEEEHTPVLADQARIQQVLVNLIDNAVKFSNENSVVTVSTVKRRDKIFVSVKDTGIGISEENINKIWDRFYKTDASRGKDKKGSGLGLSIVREIIQAHRETIDVISTPGIGTEFIFTLKKG